MRSDSPRSPHEEAPRASGRPQPGLGRALVVVGLTGLACGAAPAVGIAASQVVRATADAEVQAVAPSSRLGARPAMRIDATPQRLGLVQFSVPVLPGVVTSAKLKLYVTRPSANGPAVFATGAHWSESGVSWKRRPPLMGTALDQERSVGRGWIVYDVTSAVRTSGTVSFALVARSKDGLTVATRQSDHAPRLRITTGAAEATAPSTAATAKAEPQGAGPEGAGPGQRPGAPGGGPAFADDFNGPLGAPPDPSRWVDYGPQCGGAGGWGSIVCGGNNEYLDGNGHLVIRATPSEGAALMTQGMFGFVYGTMSAWIRMPAHNGYWPAFWSLNGTQTGNELTGEIDTAEVYTALPGSNSTAHAWSGMAHLWKSAEFVGGQDATLSNDFHKYSATIAPAKITFFLDDVEVGSLTKAAAPGLWPWGPDVVRPNFLILDLAVGGAGQGAPTAPAEMLVDRVEVTT